MFELSVLKQDILAPLLIVFGAVGKKAASPLLSHILLSLRGETLTLTATDLELEISARIPCSSVHAEGEIAVPAKKFVDIIRSLDDQTHPTIKADDAGILIREGRSLFKVATLPAQGFPRTQDEQSDFELSLPTMSFTKLLQSTYFAVSQQDVRVFLNCLLLDIDASGVTAVGTDGHRMAIAKLPLSLGGVQHRMLLPRRAIAEMLRLVAPLNEEHLVLSAGKNYFRIVTKQFTFISKLVESRFPVYTKAIPHHHDIHVTLDTDQLKRALNRIVILAHEKSRAVLMHVQEGVVTLVANNQEKEEAIESLEAKTEGSEIKIGLNAHYLLDVLSCINGAAVHLSFTDSDSSILVTTPNDEDYKYIIMPMKL
jgi:DNA polymerase III subunit beta